MVPNERHTVEVWTDGNGYGYYAYVTNGGMGTIGRLDEIFKNRGRNATCAEAQALLAALENVNADEIKVHVDSSAVLGMIAKPAFLKRPNHQWVRPAVERILYLLTVKNVRLKWIHGKNNRAHEMLVPYSRNRPLPEFTARASRVRSQTLKCPSGHVVSMAE
jgi:ribonuclease HI